MTAPPQRSRRRLCRGPERLLPGRRSWASEGLSRTALKQPGRVCIPPA